jgi:hypothetical protein
VSSESASTYRLELTLRKPRLGWYPKPTVVIDGRGHPAQWGVGTWQVTTTGSSTASVFLFNRLWKFGEAEFVLGAQQPASLVYSAPLLPFLRGRIREG